MKPSFALNLSDTAIGLLHRTQAGWLPVGEAAFDAPDLDEALGYLRRSALGLAPRGVTTKVVIPNSQILYTEVEAPGPDDDLRRQQIRAALEGRTPYPVEDLIFDWSGDGPVVQVAVVARETLAEAEAFAVTHRFNPVSFVAIPDAPQAGHAAFEGEPWFGPAALAPSYLQPGESVERDRDPIAIRNRDGLRVEDGTAEAAEAVPKHEGDAGGKAVDDDTAGAERGRQPETGNGPSNPAEDDPRDRRAAHRAARAARRSAGQEAEATPPELSAATRVGGIDMGGQLPESDAFAAGEAAGAAERSTDADAMATGAAALGDVAADRSDPVNENEAQIATPPVPDRSGEDSPAPMATPAPRPDATLNAPDRLLAGSGASDRESIPDIDPAPSDRPASHAPAIAAQANLGPGFSGAPALGGKDDAQDRPEAATSQTTVPDPVGLVDPTAPTVERGPSALTTPDGPSVGNVTPTLPGRAAPTFPGDATFASRRTTPPPPPSTQRPAFVAPVRADAPAVPSAVAERLAARIRAKAAEALPAARPKLARPVPAISGGAFGTPQGSGQSPAPLVGQPYGPMPAPSSGQTGPAPDGESLARPVTLPARGVLGGPQAVLGSATPAQGQPQRPFGAQVTASSIPGARKKKGPTTVAPITAAPATATALKPLTKPGGTFGTKAAARGTPKYLGLVLTGLLLLVLAIVAAWSTLVLATRDGDLPAPAASLAAPGIEDEMLADLQDPAEPEMVSGAPGAGSGTALAERPVFDAAAPIVAPEPLADPADAVTQAAAAAVPVPALPDDARSNAEAVASGPVQTADPIRDAASADVAMVTPTATTGPDGIDLPRSSADPVETAPLVEMPAVAEAAPVAEPPPVTEPAPGTVLSTEAPIPATPDTAQDEIFLAAMDAPPPVGALPAMPVPASRADVAPAAAPAPPPFGTVYQFDAAGLIVPTAEGIITPEGVRLVAGRPPLVPPQRPAPSPATEADAGVVPIAAATALPDVAPEAGARSPGAVLPLGADPAATAAVDAFPSDPALANARPLRRPAELVPPPEATTAGDDASLAVAPDARIAAARPLPRPQVVLAVGDAARIAAEGASLSLQAAALATPPERDPDASPLAVSVSRKPAPRPRDISGAVEAAVAAAVRAPEPEVSRPDPAATAMAAIAPAARTPARPPERAAAARTPARDGDREANEDPEADEEPEVASAAPRIPTRASVAKQATYANALNLSKVNLIGVYGTPSNRYAMVRQTNGRFKKVGIGDRVDGGTVAAITASELRYQKGGRMLSLKMPRS